MEPEKPNNLYRATDPKQINRPAERFISARSTVVEKALQAKYEREHPPTKNEYTQSQKGPVIVGPGGSRSQITSPGRLTPVTPVTRPPTNADRMLNRIKQQEIVRQVKEGRSQQPQPTKTPPSRDR